MGCRTQARRVLLESVLLPPYRKVPKVQTFMIPSSAVLYRNSAQATRSIHSAAGFIFSLFININVAALDLFCNRQIFFGCNVPVGPLNTEYSVVHKMSHRPKTGCLKGNCRPSNRLDDFL